MLATWLRTVFSDSTRASAMARSLRPSATSRSTSISLLVSPGNTADGSGAAVRGQALEPVRPDGSSSYGPRRGAPAWSVSWSYGPRRGASEELASSS